MDRVKALTIQQPWADLIMRGKKRIENRTWGTKYEGPLIIHAAAGRSRLNDHPAGKSSKVFGAALGTVQLIDCIDLDALDAYISDHPKRAWIRDHPFTEGPVLWLFADPIPFEQPIPAKGKLGLWSFDAIPTSV